LCDKKLEASLKHYIYKNHKKSDLNAIKTIKMNNLTRKIFQKRRLLPKLLLNLFYLFYKKGWIIQITRVLLDNQ